MPTQSIDTAHSRPVFTASTLLASTHVDPITRLRAHAAHLNVHVDVDDDVDDMDTEDAHVESKHERVRESNSSMRQATGSSNSNSNSNKHHDNTTNGNSSNSNGNSHNNMSNNTINTTSSIDMSMSEARSLLTTWQHIDEEARAIKQRVQHGERVRRDGYVDACACAHACCGDMSMRSYHAYDIAHYAG